jgi:hypothetical protein|tara:strand:+ start:34 stop:612 length:579 start_codon:yes stop_codon:yes gene_type:complete
MATEVSICSNALRQLGDDPITSLNDDTTRARLCNGFFNDARDAVLRAHPWNFAITRASLARLSDAPPYGFAFQFALPTDPYCLRVLEMEEASYIFKIENSPANGRVLVTNESNANILFVARVTDAAQFDTLFVDALTAKMSVDLCYPVTGSTSLLDKMNALYEKKLSEARSVDGMEGVIDDLQSDTFTSFRI